MPADALWTLAMACNVYLTFFRRYDSDQLRRLEWKYLAFCYGLPFIPAFAYVFIQTEARGKVYGSALIWCWVAPSWDFLRVALFYGPVWFVIFLTLGIYARIGKLIYQRGRQLRKINKLYAKADCETPNEPVCLKTTEIHITSEAAAPNEISRSVTESLSPISPHHPPSIYGSYSVTIEGGQGSGLPLKPPRPLRPETLKRRAMVGEINSAAWAYTKYAMLFFIALIITWVPSTVNRVYAIAFPHSFSFVLNHLSSFVLPLQGFWNSIIYTMTEERGPSHPDPSRSAASPSPPPPVPIPLTPGPRAAVLQKVFDQALGRTLRANSYANFSGCFPTPAKYVPASLESVWRQLNTKLEESARAEFEDIVEEKDAVRQLNELDSAHTLSPDELYRAHLAPYLLETQTTLDSKIEATQTENAELAQRVQAQRVEIESLLSGLESVVSDLEGAAAAATHFCEENDLRKEAFQMDGEVKARSDI
ncbi:uncharacterized protein KD926_006592 [Aspergillus affinis]|uniref:uncharacterized protein n=1 Tax=Aspergillus affinis TaxID=1070780 RepID=UPI0022FEEA31|nr:uncharacterized protein KD926_006592 [Aspergillus affinis]KAI9041694.1 hypothetical protein KD926_006592 [Aspergillus affinis]